MGVSGLGRTTILLAVLMLLAGCHGKKLIPTKGVVTLDGRPLDEAVVQFYPEGDEGEPARGVTGKDGSFELSTDRVNGVRPGTYRAVVVKFDTSGAVRRKQSMLPALYGSKDTSPFRFTVPHDGPLTLALSSAPETEVK
jgi:hypothetical protein